MQLGVEKEEPMGRGMRIVQGDEIRRGVGELEVLGSLIIPTQGVIDRTTSGLIHLTGVRRGDDGMERENDGSCGS